MSLGRDVTLYAAMALGETCWIYALLSLWSLTGEGVPAPLAFAGVFALVALALAVALSFNNLPFTEGLSRGFEVVVAVFLMYIVLAFQLGQGLTSDLRWPAHLGLSSQGSPAASLGQVIGVAVTPLIWWRGLRLVGYLSPLESLSLTFKIGVAVITVVALIQALAAPQLVALRVAFPFFGAVLVGMALAHLKESQEVSGQATDPRWVRAVAGTVTIMLVAGGLATLLAGGSATQVVVVVFHWLGAVVRAIFLVVSVPLGYLVEGILLTLAFLARLFLRRGEFIPPSQQERGSLVEQFADKVREPSPVVEVLITVGQWVLVALLVLAVLWLLAWALKLRVPRERRSYGEVRESLWAEASPREDLRDLLAGLLPHLPPYVAPRRRGFTWGGEPRTLVYQLYLWLLALAERRGLSRQSWQTPAEFQGALEEMLPSGLVRRATDAFNRLRYGGHLPQEEELARMRRDWEEFQRPSAPG